MLLVLLALAVGASATKQPCVPLRNSLSNEYVCTRIQKWINEISSAQGDKLTCSDMVNNDLIEAFSTVTSADDCSLNWPTPDYEKGYVTKYQDKIYKAYHKFFPPKLVKLYADSQEAANGGSSNEGGSILESNQQRNMRTMGRNVDGTVDNSAGAEAGRADETSVAEAQAQVHYVHMTAHDYLARVKRQLGQSCDVPRWPCCSELLRKLEEEALEKQMANQAPPTPTPTDNSGESNTPPENNQNETNPPAENSNPENPDNGTPENPDNGTPENPDSGNPETPSGENPGGEENPQSNLPPQ